MAENKEKSYDTAYCNGYRISSIKITPGFAGKKLSNNFIGAVRKHCLFAYFTHKKRRLEMK